MKPLSVPIPLSDEARFTRRAYCSDIKLWYYNDPERLQRAVPSDLEFVEWMSESGINRFFWIQHPVDTDDELPHMAEAMRKAGIGIEYGGHILPMLLPRERIKADPEAFRLSDKGERVPDGNCCPESPVAMQAFAAGIDTMLDKHPETPLIHIWGADIEGGGWCHCDKCKKYTPQDQLLLICNRIAEHIEGRSNVPDITYLAYHDTLLPDLSIQPHLGVSVEFAPRERSYRCSLNGPDELNQPMCRGLEEYVKIFGGRVHIFEYHMDSILFGGMAVPLLQTLYDDLNYYASLGVESISNLYFVDYSIAAHAPNFPAYALWTRIGEPGPDEFRQALLGDKTEIWHELEEVVAFIIAYADIRYADKVKGELFDYLHISAGTACDLLGVIQKHPRGIDPALLRYSERLARARQFQIEAKVCEAKQADELKAAAVAALEETDAILEAMPFASKGLFGQHFLPYMSKLHKEYLSKGIMMDPTNQEHFNFKKE
jgi:Domain of unknown function (DUF4838)